MSRGNRRASEAGEGNEPGAISAFLRSVADWADRDPELARRVAAALRSAGVVVEAAADRELPARSRMRASAGRAQTAQRATVTATESPLDPFAIVRRDGEQALRAALDGLDLASLRRVVRAYHLDPNRVASRWSARERVITLIVEQVRARARLGSAFERV
jgi:hypothetical protein